MKRIIIFITSLLLLFGCGKVEDNKDLNDAEPSKTGGNIEDNNKGNEKTDDKDENYEIENKIKGILKNMTIEEKTGQLFLVRCPLEDKADFYLSMNPGGFIMFGRDFANKTKDQVIDNIQGFQSKTKIPMIIGVDEEGGEVVRVSSNPLLSKERFKSPQELYELGGFEEIGKDTINKSKLLLELGINLNLAPVADVSVNETDFMHGRSFGKDANKTAEYIKAVVNAMKELNSTEDIKISGALKHFPGYGNNIDTHTGSAYETRPCALVVNNDFLPFMAGIEAGIESVLVSHNIVESIDSNFPASLSKKVIDILRDELNFNGIIMTDDLSMGAIKKLNTCKEPEILAIEAGNDMLIVTDFEISYNILLNAEKEGIISEERINESVTRILMWKYNSGIIDENSQVIR